MESPQPTLDYRSPQAAPPRGVFSVSAFFASAVVVALLLADLLLVVPRFNEIFRDFGMKLPAMTQALIAFSWYFARGPWVVLLPVPVVIGFLVGLLGPAPAVGERPRRWTLTYQLATLALAIILLVTIVGLFPPMISLIRAIG